MNSINESVGDGFDALGLIAAERSRHVSVEGWTPAHDDEHDDGSLARAAACYALPRPRKVVRWILDRGISATVPREWPESWASHWWKPTPNDRIRELTKAGALIVAEMERLHRAASPSPVVADGQWRPEWNDAGEDELADVGGGTKSDTTPKQTYTAPKVVRNEDGGHVIVGVPGTAMPGAERDPRNDVFADYAGPEKAP